MVWTVLGRFAGPGFMFPLVLASETRSELSLVLQQIEHTLPEGRFWKGFIYNLLRAEASVASTRTHVQRKKVVVTENRKRSHLILICVTQR
uniref:Putative secreted protein n=1 Tax=Anopheles darlingi TaxID=43151 RepID=A0A2M4DN50_ANODA